MQACVVCESKRQIREAGFEMQFRSRGQIHVDVVHARKWFEEIGISTAGTRLELIHQYFDELLNPSMPEKTNPLGVGATEEDTYYALADGAGFGLIKAEMSKLPDHLLPRSTLRDILKGPLVASREDRTSSDSRNKFVELELAAHFSSAGIQILGFDDLKFGFEGHTYLVECKRPFFSETLEDNIEKAYAQLRARLSCESDRGIVAVAVERVFGLESKIHCVDSPLAVHQFAVSVVRALSIRISKYQRSWVDTRVVGVLAIVRFLMKNKLSDVIAASYQLGLLKFSSAQVAQATESERLDRLIRSIRARFLQT